ncbi:unnamed protein product [Rhizoctonia solani]|uniref:cytochrome-b5 reductase n=1 Tax=Rhizoctonia solani TaxID=456999 RepID=A0A8H2WZX0_9AGAM|nr:unnamed protein product [Rhizoctonia solani]
MTTQPVTALDSADFRDFSLKEVIRYNHNTAKVRVPSSRRQRDLCKGGGDDNEGKPVVRPYTPVSAPHTPGELALVIKRYPDGTDIHTLFHRNLIRHIMTQHSLAQPNETTKFKLIFGNVTPADILIREELDEMASKSNGRFEVRYIISRPDETWTGAKGRIDAKVIKSYLPGPELGSRVMVFVCGPPGQVAAVSGPKDGLAQGELGGALKDLGYVKEQVYYKF